MRRLLIALATALVAGGIWAGAAYADAGPHGGFNDAQTTGAGTGAATYRCSSCHRAHTASGPELIKSASTYLLCTSCHGQASGLDALDGVDWSTTPNTTATPPVVGVIGGGNKAGGFLNSFMNTTLSNTGPTAYSPSTSAHRVAGMPLSGGTTTSTGQYTAWGIGGAAAGAGNAITLTCSTCHDPHGGSGGVNPTTGAKIKTYRILRADIASKIPGSGAGDPVVVPEDLAATHEYTVPDVTLPNGTVAPEAYYGQAYPTNIMQALNSWCATCHTRIHTAGSTNPANVSTNDGIFNYRHPTTGVNVSINLGTSVTDPLQTGGYPGCVTCHTSHGSSATNVGRVGSNGVASPLKIEVPGGSQTTGPFQDSALLRLNNRGVCETCHNK